MADHGPIDLKNLFFYILKKISSLIPFAVIGLIFGTGVSILKMIRSSDEQARRFLFKYPVYSILFFCLIWAGYLMFRYVFDPHLKTDQEICDKYDLQVLAFLKCSHQSYKGLIRRIVRWEENNMTPLNDRDYLISVISLPDCGSSLIAGDMKDPDVRDIITVVTEACPEYTGTEMISADPQAFVQAQEADEIILVIKLWHTTYIEMERELEVIQQLGKEAAGVVVCF